jgi:hypothetical protein
MIGFRRMHVDDTYMTYQNDEDIDMVVNAMRTKFGQDKIKEEKEENSIQKMNISI